MLILLFIAKQSIFYFFFFFFFSFFTVTSFRHFKEKLYVVCFANIKEEINISKKILSLLLFLKNSC